MTEANGTNTNYEPSITLPFHDDSHYGTPVRLLGEGAFGLVNEYSVNHRSYAIKTYQHLNDNQTTRGDLLREVAIMIRCEFPYIIPLIDVIQQSSIDDYYAIVLPLATMSLDYAIENDLLVSDDEKDQIVYRLTAAVAYLHSRDIIHRDIKPDNVLYFDDGTVQLGDFGLAVATGCANPHGFLTTAYSGYWRAPELILAQRYDLADKKAARYHYSFEADIWALGATIYEIYAGELLADYEEMERVYYRNVSTYVGPSERPLLFVLLSHFNTFGWPDVKLWPEIRSLSNWNRWRLEDLKQLPARPTDRLSKITPEQLALIKRVCIIDPRKRPNITTLFTMAPLNRLHEDVVQTTLRSCESALDLNGYYPAEPTTPIVENKRREDALFYILSLELARYRSKNPTISEWETTSVVIRLIEHASWIVDSYCLSLAEMGANQPVTTSLTQAEITDIAIVALYIAEKYHYGKEADDADFLHSLIPTDPPGRFVYVEEEELLDSNGEAMSTTRTIKTDKSALADMELEILRTIGYDLVKSLAIDYVEIMRLGASADLIVKNLSLMFYIAGLVSSMPADKIARLAYLTMIALVQGYWIEPLDAAQIALLRTLANFVEGVNTVDFELFEELDQDADLSSLASELGDVLVMFQ